MGNARDVDYVGGDRQLEMFPVFDSAGETVGELWFAVDADGPYMGRTPFINTFEERMTSFQANTLIMCASLELWEEIDRFHPEALPWFCRECGRNYGERSWRTWPRFDDDGWLDSYRGICPKGHERMIAD